MPHFGSALKTMKDLNYKVQLYQCKYKLKTFSVIFLQIEFRLDTEYTESDHVPGNNVQISSADDGGHWSVATLVDLGLYYDIRPGPGTGMQFTAPSPWSGRIAFIGYYGYYKVSNSIQNLQGGARDSPPPGVQILSFTCSFEQK